MATFSGAVQSLTRTNIMEDVANMIINVDPDKTPFLSMLRRGSKPKGTYFEWLQDTHYDGRGDNAVVEGNEAEFANKTPVIRLGNYTQISQRSVVVTDTAQAVSNYGYSKELTYQVMKEALALKKDMEIRLLGNYGSSAGSAKTYAPDTVSDGTAYQTAGVTAWMTSNVNRASNGANGGWNSNTKLVAAATAGTARDLKEEMFVNMFSQIMTRTEDIPKTVFVPIYQKAMISRTFKGVGTIQPTYPIARGSAPSTLTAISSIDFYQTDFGLVSLMWNRYMPEDVCLILNMKKWEIKFLIPYRVIPIARTGETVKRLLSVQYGLCCKHEKSNGIIADLNNNLLTVPS